VTYKRIVNGDFGGETDNPADPAGIFAEPEGRVEDPSPIWHSVWKLPGISAASAAIRSMCRKLAR